MWEGCSIRISINETGNCSDGWARLTSFSMKKRAVYVFDSEVLESKGQYADVAAKQKR
jgi:hypothetical protein